MRRELKNPPDTSLSDIKRLSLVQICLSVYKRLDELKKQQLIDEKVCYQNLIDDALRKLAFKQLQKGGRKENRLTLRSLG